MRQAALAVLLLPALLSRAAAAEAARPHSTTEAGACADAAAGAERAWALPPGLVGAIGQVESGRYDPAAGRVSPWPWTVNAEGAGRYFATLDAAAAHVRALQARGVRLIDVGCFQVDLFYHPDAFVTLEEAFDPAANATYAARFLTALHARAGSWAGAVAGYHSGAMAEGDAYRRKVMAAWGGAATVLAATVPAALQGLLARNMVPLAARGGDPHVVLMSEAARAIQVFGPARPGLAGRRAPLG